MKNMFYTIAILLLPTLSFAPMVEKGEGAGEINSPVRSREKQTFDKLSGYVCHFEELVPAARDTLFNYGKPGVLKLNKLPKQFGEKLYNQQEDTSESKITEDRIMELKKQAKILAKEKWTRERWQTEIIKGEQGLTYSESGALMGFNLGAAAGMLIGRGFQGRKVYRQKSHSEWDINPQPKNIYYYKHKYAPYWGGAIGAAAGTITGYIMGRRADKKYYIFVPRHIRMQRTRTSWGSNYLIGFGIIGPVMGIISGNTLYAPESTNVNAVNIGAGEFLSGYLVGSITGTFIVAAIKTRSRHRQLWETSLMMKNPESSLNIQLMPLDPKGFSIYNRTLPSGETYYEYQIDLIRVRF